MPQDQRSFADRLARIERDKGTPTPATTPERPSQVQLKRPPAPSHSVGALGNFAAFVVVICVGFGLAFAFGGADFQLRVLSVLSPGFGHVASAEDVETDRYEWDTKPTPFNASRLGMKRMNAFAQDMSDLEMRELVRRANDLGQPFLANEIERRMGACDTLKCRAVLQSEYEAQLTQLRKSTPTW